MPGKNQRVITVPKDVYERVRREVEEGREENISRTFVKAVEFYLNERDTLVEDINWFMERVREIRNLERAGES